MRFLHTNGVKTLLVVALTLTTSACVRVDTANTASNKAKFEAITPLTVSSPGFALQKNARIAWLPEAIRFYRDTRIDSTGIKKLVEQTIYNELAQKGHTLTLDTTNADYLIAYTAALESSLNDKEILLSYGLLPGKYVSEEHNQKHEKGSLIIYLIKPITRTPVWKSVVQADVKFEINNYERSKRIQLAIHKMFSALNTKIN